MDNFIGCMLCKESDRSIGEYVFGGRLLELVAEYGAIYALKLTGEKHLLGYRFDEIVISSPVRAGDVLNFYASKPKYGNNSVAFDIAAKVKDKIVITGKCVYVNIDQDGNKKPITQKNLTIN